VLLAKEGASGVMVGDLNVDAAEETIAVCQTVATHPQFQGKAVLVDVTTEDSVSSLFRETVSEFARVDYCVNCAGVSEYCA
jgi:NAD(P)-dependent dehydrogenase (short-subunit alcohol dehydrogenase family)